MGAWTEVEKIEFDPEAMDRTSVYKILCGVVVPRPIGLIATRSRDGVPNVAPFSFFNAVSHVPPLVCVSIAPVLPAGRRKDTLANLTDTGEFVANIVSEAIAGPMDVCAGEYPPEVDEFARAPFTPVPSKLVGAPRVAESPVNLECRVVQILPLPESVYTMVIGRVCYMHVRSDIVLPEGRIDPQRLAAVGRMTGNSYTRTREIFTLKHDTFDHLPPSKSGGG